MIQAYKAHSKKGIILNANEASQNLPQWLLDEIFAALAGLDFQRYPDDSYSPLKEAYARYIKAAPEQIIAGSGSDQMLQMIISYFVRPGGTVSVLTPDFSMYDFYTSLFHGNLDRTEINFEKGLDLDSFVKHIKEVKPDLVLFSNPNNPTGLMFEREQIEKMARAIAPVPLCVDEAYMDFDNESAVPLLEDLENLWITRTLSKAFRLASARVGFLLSSKKNIEKIAPYKIVFNLSSTSSQIAQIVLHHYEWFVQQARKTVERRENLFQSLRENPYFEVLESHGNYLCLVGERIEELGDLFEENNISIRTYPGKNYLRITVGTPRENEHVLKVIGEYTQRRKQEDASR